MESKTSIYVETIIHATPEKVWKAWTEPALIMLWFGSDPKGQGLSATMDVQPGGQFEISFEDGDQTEHTCFGTYREVLPLTKLTFTWEWKNEPGVESFIVLLLTPEEKTTRMALEHQHVGTLSKHDYLRGWLSTFEKLEKLIGS